MEQSTLIVGLSLLAILVTELLGLIIITKVIKNFRAKTQADANPHYIERMVLNRYMPMWLMLYIFIGLPIILFCLFWIFTFMKTSYGTAIDPLQMIIACGALGFSIAVQSLVSLRLYKSRRSSWNIIEKEQQERMSVMGVVFLLFLLTMSRITLPENINAGGYAMMIIAVGWIVISLSYDFYAIWRLPTDENA